MSFHVPLYEIYEYLSYCEWNMAVIPALEVKRAIVFK